MKKLLTLAALLVLCAVCAFAIAEKDGDYTYTVNGDNTVTITGFDWKSNGARDIYIPEMLGNRMVTAIGDKAFMTTGNSAVSITLPDGIKSIGEQAFRGVAIKYINIPLNTKEIGGGAFAQCSVMQFRVASGHDTFATIENALYNKQTKTLICWPENKEIDDIPEGIINIGNYAFYGREWNHSSYTRNPYKLPTSVRYIGEYAFAQDKESKYRLNININKTEIIGDYAFYNMGIVDLTNVSNLRKIGDYAFYNVSLVCFDYDVTKTGSYDITLGQSGLTIGKYAFYGVIFDEGARASGCSLTINIAANATIGEYAFYNTSGHCNINPSFLESIKYIGERALSYSFAYFHVPYSLQQKKTYKLRSISVLSEKCFYNVKGSWFPEKIIIESKVRTIESAAFSLSNVKEVEIYEGLSEIGTSAFKDCSNLCKINIPSSVTYIGSQVFDGCSDTLVITVEKDSYGEVWARTCGYSYVINGEEEDTSWLNS